MGKGEERETRMKDSSDNPGGQVSRQEGWIQNGHHWGCVWRELYDKSL